MRQANKAVQRERFPIPNVKDTLYQMNGATVFSKLDLTQSFHQIELEESYRYIRSNLKRVIVTSQHLFVTKVFTATKD
jgi:hypothetical protein